MTSITNTTNRLWRVLRRIHHIHDALVAHPDSTATPRLRGYPLARPPGG